MLLLLCCVPGYHSDCALHRAAFARMPAYMIHLTNNKLFDQDNVSGGAEMCLRAISYTAIDERSDAVTLINCQLHPLTTRRVQQA